MSRPITLSLLALAAIAAAVGYARFYGAPALATDVVHRLSSVADTVKTDAIPKVAAPESKAQANKGPPPAPVYTAVVESKAVPIVMEGIGSVQPRSTVAIKSRVDGQLVEAFVKEGQLIKKNDPLFRIDPRPFEAALRQAEANLARDRANFDKAKGDMQRIGDLAVKGFSPQAKVEEAKAAMNSLAATIKADEAAIEIARLNVEYTMIRSLIDGRAGNILVHAGNMVKANDTQALIVITETNPIYVAFAVPEQYLPEIKARMATSKIMVEVAPPNDTRAPVQGEMFFVNNAVDMSTGTIQLMGTFTNVDQQLTPGQFVNARVTLGTIENAIVVAAKTVQVGPKGQFVYVVKPDKTVELRPVKTGATLNDQTLILSGLQKGETVVTDGQLRLFPGARVAPKEPQATPAKPKAQS